MGVTEGSETSLAWGKILRAEAGSAESKMLRGALLAYRKQDTLAMAMLLDVLYEHTRD